MQRSLTAYCVQVTSEAEDKLKEDEAKEDEPKKIGYKVFKDGREASHYYRNLLTNLTKHQDLNEVPEISCCCFKA
jgi:hypothetical protein